MNSKYRAEERLHYGYVVVIGLAMLMLVEALIMGCANIFVTPVSESLGVSVGTVGNHITFRSFGLCIWGVPAGAFLRKYDTRITLTITVLLTAVCLFIYSVAQHIYVFYACSFCIAFAASILCMQIIPMLTNNWFAKNSAFWLGVCAAMQGLFGTVFQNIGSVIIASSGWRACFRTFAVIALAIGLPAAILLVRKSPADMGLHPVGYTGACDDAAEELRTHSGMSMAAAKKTVCFWLSIVIMGVISIGSVFNYYLTSYLRNVGLDTVSAGACSSVLMIGMLVGKVFCGKIYSFSAKLGALSPIFGIVALPVLLVCGSNTLLISVACFLWGITYASCTLSGAEICKYNFGLKDFTAIYALACSFNGVGGAVGTAMWGLTIDHIGYRVTIILAWCAYVLALIISIASIWLGGKLRKTAWTMDET